MKKRIITTILIIILLFSMSACDNSEDSIYKKLNSPEDIIVLDGILTWNPIYNADYYDISINGDIFSTQSNSCDLLQPNIDYDIKLRARNLWGTSEWSKIYKYNILSVPKNLSYNSENYQMTWTKVEGANGYIIKYEGQEYILDGEEKGDFVFDKAGNKNIQIKALGDGVNTFDSAYSEYYNFNIEPIDWDIVLIRQPKGDGSKENPFFVENINNFKWVSAINNVDNSIFKDKYIIQTVNIDFRYVEGYQPLGTTKMPFLGYYNGNGYQMKYLNISSDIAGIFGMIGEGSKVEKVIRFRGTTVGTKKGAGVVAVNYGLVNGCRNYESKVNANIAGGVIAENTDNMIVFDAVNTGSVFGENVGGIVGMNWNGSINSCKNYGDVSSLNRAGGIVSFSSGNLIACANYATVSGTIVGGLAAENIKDIYSSSNYGEIVTSKIAGGVAGVNTGEIYYSYGTGEFYINYDSKQITIGGIVGEFNDGKIEVCYSMSHLEKMNDSDINIGSILGYYRSGFINYAYSLKSTASFIANTENFVGSVNYVTIEDLGKKEFVKILNKFSDKEDLFVHTGDIWNYQEETQHPILYWEKE